MSRFLKFVRSARFLAALFFQSLRRLSIRAEYAPEIGVRVNPANQLRFDPESNNSCPDVPPRLDDIYYKPTNRLTRQYQQTWCEPVMLKIEPQPVYKTIHDDLPLPEVRPQMSRPVGAKSAYEAYENKVNLMECRNEVKSECPRLQLKGCRGSRNIHKSYKERELTATPKICAPFPAYSECNTIAPPPRRPAECRCMFAPQFCPEGIPLMAKPKDNIWP